MARGGPGHHGLKPSHPIGHPSHNCPFGAFFLEQNNGDFVLEAEPFLYSRNTPGMHFRCTYSTYLVRFCLVLFVNSVFCCGTWSSFTREELMKIRGTTPADLFPTFLLPTVELLDILVKDVLIFVHAVKRRRRGKHAGAFVHLHQRGLHAITGNISFQRVFTVQQTGWTSATGVLFYHFFHLQFYVSQRHGCMD